MNTLQSSLWNVCSLNNKLPDLMEHILDRGSDVVFLTETWLQDDENAITAEIKTYGYRLLHDRRKDREKARGGGVGILVRSTLIAKQLSVKHFHSFEHTIVKMPLAKKKILYLISVYRLQYVAVSTFMEEFSELLDLYTVPYEHFVIAGDFNIHFESESSNAKQFKDLLHLYDLKQSILSPTHVKGHTLDLVITSMHSIPSDISVAEIDLSHHYLVDFKLKAEPNTYEQKLITYRSTKNVDLAKFTKDVEDQLNALPPTDDLATKVSNYNSAMTKIVDDHTCLKTRKMKIVPDAPWFDVEYANLRKLRRNAEKKYRRSGKESDRKLYCTLRKQAVQTSFNKKKTFVTNKLKQGNSCKSLYSVVNDMIDNKKEIDIKPTSKRK